MFCLCVLAHLVNVLFCHEGCELHDGHDHGERGAFDGHKSFVDVDAHGVCGFEEGFAVLLAENVTDDFNEELLGVACAEVESDCFEDKTFETDDYLARGFKDLGHVSK